MKNISLKDVLVQQNNSQYEQDSTNNEDSIAICVAVYNIILSAVTVLSNGFLLLALCTDPLKCFRNASSFLVISMTCANLVTGTVVEPLTAALCLAEHYNIDIPKIIESLDKAFIFITPNASFFSLFALSLETYIAASMPLKYKFLVTKRNALISIFAIWLYIITFSLLQFSGVSEKLYFKLDLYLNTTAIFILLLASYIGLVKSLQTNMKRASTLHPVHSATFHVSWSRRLNEERSRRSLNTVFVLIIILTLTLVPNMISWLLFLNCPACKLARGFPATQTVLRYIVYLKFAMDPFVYAWLMPRYRKALMMASRCQFGHTEIACL